VRREAEVREALAGAAFRLRTALSRTAQDAGARLAQAAAAPLFSRPLDELIGARRQRLDEAALRLAGGARQVLSGARETAAALGGRLEGLNPLAVLGRGYSVTLDPGGRPLRDASRAPAGTRVRTILARGRLVSRVEEIEDGAEEEG
jgi:exodeoxyribonuclease VII large subunit